MRTPLLALALILAPAAPAFAGVLVVDPANGPGTDFTSLAAALQAAAPGDVLLLRNGTYDGSFVTGKSIAIFADGTNVTIKNSALGNPAVPALQIGGQDPGTTLLRGLKLSTPQGGGVPLLVSGASGAGGHVWVEDCDVPQSGGVGMQIGDNISPVTLVHSDVHGSQPDATLGAGGFPASVGQPGVSVGAGPLAVFGGMLFGGDGLVAGLYGPLPLPVAGADGSPGLHIANVDSSLKILSAAVCIGGVGGAGANPGMCLPPGDGGDGVLVTQNGNVHVTSLYGTGNLPGAPAAGCGQLGGFGELLASEPPGQTPTWLPGVPADIFVSGVWREGQVATVIVQVPLEQSAGLLIGLAPTFEYLPNFSGALVATPEIAIPIGTAPPPGTFTLHVPIPELGPGVESIIAYVQVFTRNAAGKKTLGAPSAVLMLDSQF